MTERFRGVVIRWNFDLSLFFFVCGLKIGVFGLGWITILVLAWSCFEFVDVESVFLRKIAVEMVLELVLKFSDCVFIYQQIIVYVI